MMTPELKPCPFCGGNAFINRLGDRRQSTIYMCEECGCTLETPEESNYGEHWNHRTDAHPVTVAGAILDAQIRAFERGRIDTPDEIRAAVAQMGMVNDR